MTKIRDIVDKCCADIIFLHEKNNGIGIGARIDQAEKEIMELVKSLIPDADTIRIFTKDSVDKFDLRDKIMWEIQKRIEEMKR